MPAQPIDPPDPMDGRVLRCTVVMDAAGAVTLFRGAGCTPQDAAELCRLVAAADPVVRDVPPAVPPRIRWLHTAT